MVPETGMWFVTRRDDVVGILRDATVFTTDSPNSTIRDIFGAHMMTTDGEVALRYKRACLHAFWAQTVVEEMGGWVQDEVDRLVGSVEDDAPFDLVEEVAAPLALGSVLRVLGLPADLAGRIHEWYDVFAVALANFKRDPAVRQRGKRAAAAFDAEVRPRLDDLGPSDLGLLAHLATREDDAFTHDEIISNALIILFGGIETTESMIANTVWSVLTTDSWEAVRADPDLRAQAIEEALR